MRFAPCKVGCVFCVAECFATSFTPKIAVSTASAPGIVYPSVRDPQGECLAAFRTTMLRDCRHAAYLEYNWNGEAIDYVFELNQVG